MARTESSAAATRLRVARGERRVALGDRLVNDRERAGHGKVIVHRLDEGGGQNGGRARPPRRADPPLSPHA